MRLCKCGSQGWEFQMDLWCPWNVLGSQIPSPCLPIVFIFKDLSRWVMIKAFKLPNDTLLEIVYTNNLNNFKVWYSQWHFNIVKFIPNQETVWDGCPLAKKKICFLQWSFPRHISHTPGHDRPRAQEWMPSTKWTPSGFVVVVGFLFWHFFCLIGLLLLPFYVLFLRENKKRKENCVGREVGGSGRS